MEMVRKWRLALLRIQPKPYNVYGSDINGQKAVTFTAEAVRF